MRARRQELGLSQEELGRRLGTTLRTYARWERGETSGYMTQLAEIARALETSERDLLGGEDPLPAQPTMKDLALRLDELGHEVRRLRADLEPILNLGRLLQPNGTPAEHPDTAHRGLATPPPA